MLLDGSWFFFAEATPALFARQDSSSPLTETMERRPDIGLRSDDQFFPNQDTCQREGVET